MSPRMAIRLTWPQRILCCTVCELRIGFGRAYVSSVSIIRGVRAIKSNLTHLPLNLCFTGAVMAILLLRDTDAPDNQGQEIRNREGQEMNIEDNFAKRGDDSEMK
jgi:hypothetical protein